MRNLKALGLALAAVFAMSAMATANASAETGILTETSGLYPVHVHGTDTPAPAVKALTGTGLAVECTEATYTGTLAEASTTLSITPTYAKCMQGEVHGATVTMNGCTYLFHVGTRVEEDLYNVTADLKCPLGKVVEVHIYTNTEHTTQYCTLTLAEQNGLTGLQVTDETKAKTGKPDALDIHGTIKGIKYQTHGTCSFGLTVNKEDGELHVAATVEGTEGREITVATK